MRNFAFPNPESMKRNDGIIIIGPRSRGGMDAVLVAYQAMMPGAYFVSSYRGGSRLRKMADFVSGYTRATWLLLRHPEIKIVHIHSASNASFRRKMYFARLAKRLGRKVVMHIHGGGFRDFLATDPEGIVADINSCDEMICLTEQWGDFFRSQGVERVNVVPNPVDYPSEVIREAPDGKTHFLFLGVLERAKGVTDLVEAVASLPAELRDVMVVHIGGTGVEEPTLKEIIASHGLEKTVVLEGWVTGRDKERLLSRCGCYVLPSYFEGQPVSILEGMAWEMPVIATEVGGIPSVVTDDVNGFLITPGDIKALAAAMTRIITDKELVKEMGRRSREIASRYSSEQVRNTLSKIYSRYGVDL